MSLRPLLPASSRLLASSSSLTARSAGSRPVLPSQTPLQTRHISFPHPALTQPPTPNTSPYLLVRTANRIASPLHALAILQHVSKALSQPIIDVSVPIDNDTAQPLLYLKITVLHPVTLNKPLFLEMPNPQAPTSDYLGGPSLADVRAVLGGEAPPEEGGEPVRFRVEISKSTPSGTYGRTEGRRRATGRRGDNNNVVNREEDQEIVAALKVFGDGFFGGFEGLADRFAHLSEDPAGEGPGLEDTKTGSQQSDRREPRRSAKVQAEGSASGPKPAFMDLFRQEVKARPPPPTPSTSTSAPPPASFRRGPSPSAPTTTPPPSSSKKTNSSQAKHVRGHETKGKEQEIGEAEREREAAVLGGKEGEEQVVVKEMGGGEKVVDEVQDLRSEQKEEKEEKKGASWGEWFGGGGKNA